MDEPGVKGFDLIAGLRMAASEFDPHQHERFESTLSEAFRREQADLKPGAWYPVAWSEELDRGYIAALGVEDGQPAADLIERYARTAARRNMNTVLRLVMRFLKPHSLVRVLPKFWKRYFNCGAVSLKELSKEEHRAVLALTGFPHKRYMAPACVGWIKEAFAMLGIADARVVAVGYDPDDPTPADCEFRIEWGRKS